jgi:hypothetical protein
VLVLIGAGIVASCTTIAENHGSDPLVIKEQGSFAAAAFAMSQPDDVDVNEILFRAL